MAVLVMSSSKNSCYDDAKRYLQYKHQEDLQHSCYKPVLDEYGLLQERSNYGLCYINGYGQEKNPDDWAGNCVKTNLAFGKNHSPKDRKQFIFVISHPESDTPFLTKEALMDEGRAFVRENLQGYDALIAVHMDTDNYHIHISINSVRAVDRHEQPWMMKDRYGCVLHCETAAGYKHQNNPEFRRHCQQWLLQYTRSHGLTAEDNIGVEDQRRQERYTERHERLRKTILDTAARCKSMQELTRQLHTEYNIDLIRRGTTYSVRPPGARKSIRLNSIDLPIEKIYRTMQVPPTELQSFQKAKRIEYEQKKYMQWIQERREKNNRKAEDTIADAASLIARKVSVSREYHREDFQELHDLIKQTTYLERDLQTERDKIDRILNRWDLFLDPSTSSDDRLSHGSYLSWCGCNPSSNIELQDLRMEREIVSLQMKEAASVREALVESADRWKDHNAESRFYYHQSWTLRREEQLKHQLAAVKYNRIKLSRIAYNCQKAAGHRIYNQELLRKAAHFRGLWHDKLMEEKAVKRELKQVRREIKATFRDRGRDR